MFQAKMLPIYLGKFSQISAWRGFCLTSADIWRLADWFLQVISTKTGAVKQITVSVGIYWLSDFCLGDNNYKYWMGVSNMTFIFHFIWMNSMIFQRGRSTTNQYNNYKYWMVVSNIFYFPVHIWDLLFLIFFWDNNIWQRNYTYDCKKKSRRARTRCRTLWQWRKTTVVLIRGGTLETTTSGAGKTRHIHPWQLDV
jgi:hypothetical protein